MNNKRGGFGAKLLLVLILMIASAVGGAYAYRVADGKLAARDALKAVENVDISDYDTAEQSIIQGFVDEAKKNLETAKTRKEVYDIISDFIGDVDKVQTSNEKKLEEALKEAEEAKRNYNNSYNSNNNNNSNNGSGLFGGNNNNNTDNSYDSNTDSSYDANNNTTDQSQDASYDTEDTTDDSGNYKNNDLNTESGQEEESGGFLNSLLGGLANGSDDN